MHRNPVVCLAHTSDQLDHLQIGVVLAGVVQGEGTVFATAPEKGSFAGCVHEEGSTSWLINRGVAALHTHGCLLQGGRRSLPKVGLEPTPTCVDRILSPVPRRPKGKAGKEVAE